jgi:hypothetical protein
MNESLAHHKNHLNHSSDKKHQKPTQKSQKHSNNYPQILHILADFRELTIQIQQIKALTIKTKPRNTATKTHHNTKYIKNLD